MEKFAVFICFSQRHFYFLFPKLLHFDIIYECITASPLSYFLSPAPLQTTQKKNDTWDFTIINFWCVLNI